MHSFAWWPTLVVLAVATYTDLRSRRIPNWLVGPFFLAGVGTSIYMHGLSGAARSLEGMALGTLIYGLLSWMGGMGMGDVKLCAAIGAWIGPGQLVTALIFTGLVGGAMALGWAMWGGFLGELLGNTGKLMAHVKERGLQPHPDMVLSAPKTRKMPYAPAIAIGTLASFFAG